MSDNYENVESYIAQLAEDRKEVFEQLREIILENLPNGFAEMISYRMVGYVVPHSIYPDGYHCNPKLPLPFLSIASQKNAISLYHMGIYADSSLLEWFIGEYPKHSNRKLDMGKSCIRFKKLDEIPFDLIGELVRKMSVEQWIRLYEINFKK